MNVECEALSVNECVQPWNAGAEDSRDERYILPEATKFQYCAPNAVSLQDLLLMAE